MLLDNIWAKRNRQCNRSYWVRLFLVGVSTFSGHAYSEQQQDSTNLEWANDLTWISTNNHTQLDSEITINDFVRLLISAQPEQFGREFFFHRFSGRDAHKSMSYCYKSTSNEFDRERCYAAGAEADNVVDMYLSKITLDKTKKYPTNIGYFGYVTYHSYDFNLKKACFTKGNSKSESFLEKTSLFNIPYNTKNVPGRFWKYGFSEMVTLADLFPDLYNSSDVHIRNLFHKSSLPDYPLMPLGVALGGRGQHQFCYNVDINTAEQLSKSKSDNLYIKGQIPFNPLDAVHDELHAKDDWPNSQDHPANSKYIYWKSSRSQKECIYSNDKAISCREVP